MSEIKFNETEKLFRYWIEQGWRLRLRSNDHMREHISEYRERLKREVAVIQDKDFIDYFLMVSDMIRWAKSQGIAVGPGRGSSAGSLVCYLLRITEINPMLYPMLFERFLDPTRTDPPDIDTDFDDSRRDEVFSYATQKYGYDRVANIGTFTRYLGKNSIDDVARVYHIPAWMAEQFKSKLLVRAEGHPRFSKSIEDTINSFSDVKALVNSRSELSYAEKLEGNVRNFGIHAAALAIGSVPLNEICATFQKIEEGKVRQAIAYDKYDASYLGLLKIDILSLATLGMLAKVCELAGISFGSLYDIPLDDQATWDLFKQGDMLGVFQFEGITTRRILKQVGPQNIMELSDVNALARPGASDETYIANKKNGRMPSFPHPIMEQHLSWTHGVIVYEEQILMILRDLGGFAPAELNRMRKIIHDKLGSTAFNENFARFVKGCAAHGLSENVAESIWDTMVGASGYAFCVTGDTVVERGGLGGNDPKGSSPKITVAELYSRQESSTPIGKKIRSGRLSLLSMDDDGRVRPNKLLQIQHPVKYRCMKITTDTGRTLTMSNDHKILTVEGYKVALSLVIGEKVFVELGWAAREAERIKELTKYRQEGYKEWDGIKGEGNPGWIDGRTETLRDTYDFVWIRDQKQCCHCKKEWDGTSHGLEFAHIMTLEFFEGDYLKYNSAKNVMLLCNSCHKKFDYRVQGTRNKKWSRGRLTGLETIVKIEDSGIQDVYDIYMSGPSHNYVGNGFINHNNIAHSVCYAVIGYWTEYLKSRYVPEFYTGLLIKCPDSPEGLVRRAKIVAAALRNGIQVGPPDLMNSQEDWTICPEDPSGVGPRIVAGFNSIRGIGAKRCEKILAWREEKRSFFKHNTIVGIMRDVIPLEWDDLIEVKGFGPKTIETIKEFVSNEDPFGVYKTAKVLNEARNAIKNGELPGLPSPTHVSVDIPTDFGSYVTFIGIVRERKYYDAVEQLQKRTAGNLEYEEALNQLKDKHLLKYVALYCEDEYGEQVVVRVSRWKYPEYAYAISRIKVNRDMILAEGKSSDFSGISIQAKRLEILES